MPDRSTDIRTRLSLASRVYRWYFRRAEKREAEGIAYGMLWPDDGEVECVYPKVAEALGLIARYDPRRMERLRRLSRGIYIDPGLDARGTWRGPNRLVLLQHAYVASSETTAVEVATTIVHEGAHAWLDSLGFTYAEAARARIERACIRNEAAFLRRLPDSDGLVAAAELRMNPDPAFYTDAAFLERRRRHLRGLGLPRWAIALLDWTRRLRSA